MEKYKNSSMIELMDALIINEELQWNIKNAYIKAAERDLDFIKLKKEENDIKRYITIKTGI